MPKRLPLVALASLVFLFAACSQAPTPTVLDKYASPAPTVSAQALEGALYEQLDNLTNIYSAGDSSPQTYVADDFGVPAGERWTLHEVGVNNSGSRLGLASYSVAFFAANPETPELPGPLIATRSFTHADTTRRDGLLILPLSEPVVLEPGDYWVGADGYFVRLRTPPTGQRAVRGTVGSFAKLESGFTTAPVDLAFALFGSNASILPLSLEPLLEAFNGFVAAGTLQGSGPGKSAPGRLGALRNMLVNANDLLAAGDSAGACQQLADALKRLHVSGRLANDHFATGAKAAALKALIEAAQAELCL